MPTLRIMADGRPVYATPGVADQRGVPSFAVGSGNAERLTLDLTAWCGMATLAASTWTINGGIIEDEGITDNTTSALITVPSYPLMSNYYGPLPSALIIGNIAQCSDGRVLQQAVRLVPQPAVVSEVTVFGVARLG